LEKALPADEKLVIQGSLAEKRITRGIYGEDDEGGISMEIQTPPTEIQQIDRAWKEKINGINFSNLKEHTTKKTVVLLDGRARQMYTALDSAVKGQQLFVITNELAASFLSQKSFLEEYLQWWTTEELATFGRTFQ